MKTAFAETVGTMRLVVRSDGGIYLGRPDGDGVMAREIIRLGSSAGICRSLCEALTRAAEHIAPAYRFEEEKPPAGHHAEGERETINAES